MCAVQPYVSSYLSFSFNHYISPQQVNPLYYQTYLDYLATGKVEHVRPTTPTDLTSVALDSQTIRLTWTASTDNVGVAGYDIRRDGRHVASQRDGTTTFLDGQLEPGTTYTYQVRAFDAAGNQSALSDRDHGDDAGAASVPDQHCTGQTVHGDHARESQLSRYRGR